MLTCKPIQLLWMLGGSLLVLALFHFVGGNNPASQWVSGGVAAISSLTGDGPRISLQEHMKLAEKIWAKTVRQRHELIQADWGLKNPDDFDLFPAVNVASYQKTPYSIWDFVPASYSCPYEMERIGRMGDGGKWVCGMSQYEKIPTTKPCIVYSFGVQFESSYEDEMLARTHCEIWAYDFSVVDFGAQLSTTHRARAHFTQAGISGTTDSHRSPPFYSIQDLMKMNGHTYLDILKIDIEFSEFDSLRSLSDAFSASSGLDFPIGQILIEIHLFGRRNLEVTNSQGLADGTVHPITSGEFLDWWEMLEARGIRPAFTEPNLLYSTLMIENGQPRLAEYTLINTKDPRSVLFQGLIG